MADVPVADGLLYARVDVTSIGSETAHLDVDIADGMSVRDTVLVLELALREMKPLAEAPDA